LCSSPNIIGAESITEDEIDTEDNIWHKYRNKMWGSEPNSCGWKYNPVVGFCGYDNDFSCIIKFLD
jgi:hypothetical protein